MVIAPRIFSATASVVGEVLTLNESRWSNNAESILEERTQHLDAKGLHLKQHEKLVEEMSHKIVSLQSTLDSANVNNRS